VLADLFRYFAGAYMKRHAHIAGAAVHDPLAVLALTHPDLFTSSARHVVVETRGEHTRGMTVIDRRDLIERPAPTCTVLDTVDSDAAWRLVVAAVDAASAGSAHT
jgi:inosine-uridine nucleoside N-ribohydrolase